MRKIRSIIVNGKEYKIKWQTLEQSYIILQNEDKRKRKYIDTLGLLDEDEKTIYVNPNQSDKEKFLTIIHELCHVYNPTWTEEKVVKYEQEFNALINKLNIKI